MTMNYWRTHNAAMLNAVNTLATVGPVARITRLGVTRGACEKMRTAQIPGWRIRS